jgi:hypothetical protein
MFYKIFEDSTWEKNFVGFLCCFTLEPQYGTSFVGERNMASWILSSRPHRTAPKFPDIERKVWKGMSNVTAVFFVATVCRRRYCHLPGHSLISVFVMMTKLNIIVRLPPGQTASKDSMSEYCLWNILLINCSKGAVITGQELEALMTSVFRSCGLWNIAVGSSLGPQFQAYLDQK